MVPCARCGKAFAESNQPKILRCGHTFCESCCEKGVQVGEKGKSNVLTCFECQAETPVLKKGDGVRELTTNWALIQTARDPPPPSRPADDPTQRPASHALEVTPAAEAKIREIETALTNMLKNEPIDFMRTAEEMHENLYWYSDPNRLQRVGHDPEIISLLMLFSGLLLRTSTGELPPAVRAVLLDDLLRLQFHRSEVVHQLCQNLMATFWDESTTAAALQREAGQQATADNPLAAAEAQSIALGARDTGGSSLAELQQHLLRQHEHEMRELAGRQQREQQDMAARQQHAAAGCPPDQRPHVLAEQTREQQSLLQHQEQ